MTDRIIDFSADTEGAPCLQAFVRLGEAMKLRFGAVPPRDADLLIDKEKFALAGDAFWLETPGGVQFHYRKGQSVLGELPRPELDDECRLYLWGTVFGAVAWLNGMMPLHASAVSHDGGVVAFTGASGAGKSTLAAGLAWRGFAHVCDDTLVLAEGPDGLLGLPDGKPMKLWDDAADLVGAVQCSPIASLPGKAYADPAVRETRPLPLTDLVFIEAGDETTLTPVLGAEKLTLVPGALYRGFIHAARGDEQFHSRMMFELVQSVRFWRLSRPLDAGAFSQSLEDISALIDHECGGARNRAGESSPT